MPRKVVERLRRNSIEDHCVLLIEQEVDGMGELNNLRKRHALESSMQSLPIAQGSMITMLKLAIPENHAKSSPAKGCKAASGPAALRRDGRVV
jgi:hypothetical protein